MAPAGILGNPFPGSPLRSQDFQGEESGGISRGAFLLEGQTEIGDFPGRQGEEEESLEVVPALT